MVASRLTTRVCSHVKLEAPMGGLGISQDNKLIGIRIVFFLFESPTVDTYGWTSRVGSLECSYLNSR